jgi:hypothetical protein
LDQAQIARDKIVLILVAAVPVQTKGLEITGATTITRRTMVERKRTRGERRMPMLRPILNCHPSAFQSEPQRDQIRLGLDSDVVVEVVDVEAVVEEEEVRLQRED